MIDRTLTSDGADDLCGYATRPFAFIFRYVRFRAPSHAMIVAAVLAAVVLLGHDSIRREISG